MPIAFEEHVTSRPYTVSPSTAVRGVKDISRADVIGTAFVVDDDISVRESLELLITSAGWRPLLFESAQKFLAYPRATVPSCLVPDVTMPGLTVSSCRSSSPTERKCRSSSSPGMEMCRCRCRR